MQTERPQNEKEALARIKAANPFNSCMEGGRWLLAAYEDYDYGMALKRGADRSKMIRFRPFEPSPIVQREIDNTDF